MYVVGIAGNPRTSDISAILPGARVFRSVGHSATRKTLEDTITFLVAIIDGWGFDAPPPWVSMSAFVLPNKREVMRLKLSSEEYPPKIWFRAPSSALDAKALEKEAAQFTATVVSFQRHSWCVAPNPDFDLGWDRDKERFLQFVEEWDVGW